MNISLELIGLTFSAAGEILLAITVLTVHHRLKKEHKIDKAVENEIGFEQFIGGLAILFLAIGYLLQVNFFRVFFG